MHPSLQKFLTVTVRTEHRLAESLAQVCCLIPITAVLSLTPTPSPHSSVSSPSSSLSWTLFHTLSLSLSVSLSLSLSHWCSGRSCCHPQSPSTFLRLHLCLDYSLCPESMSSCFYCMCSSVFHIQCKPHLQLLSQDSGYLPLWRQKSTVIDSKGLRVKKLYLELNSGSTIC